MPQTDPYPMGPHAGPFAISQLLAVSPTGGSHGLEVRLFLRIVLTQQVGGGVMEVPAVRLLQVSGSPDAWRMRILPICADF